MMLGSSGYPQGRKTTTAGGGHHALSYALDAWWSASVDSWLLVVLSVRLSRSQSAMAASIWARTLPSVVLCASRSSLVTSRLVAIVWDDSVGCW
jgi:hypothetical protein